MQSEITNLRELIQSALKEHQKISFDIVVMQTRLSNIEVVLERTFERLEQLEVEKQEHSEEEEVEEEFRLTWLDATVELINKVKDKNNIFTKRELDRHIDWLVKVTGSHGTTPKQTLSRVITEDLCKRKVIRRIRLGVYQWIGY